MFETLHAHTRASDGAMTHEELLVCAAKLGISVVAFTDHDSLPGTNTLKKLRSGHYGANWIVGIEISAALPRELGGKAYSGLHIVGLFVDPENGALRDHCRRAKEDRIERMRSIVSKLQKLGFEITEQDCLATSKGESVGRPHIVEALKSQPKNVSIIEELRRKMANEAKYDEAVARKFKRMMTQGEQQYPYALFLGDDAYLRDVYVDHKYCPDLDESVKLIRDAGGVAIIAHYNTAVPKLPFEKLEEIIRSKRLDGAESVFGLWGLGTELEKEINTARMFILGLHRKYECVLGGGADAHNENDLISFIGKPDYASLTRGMSRKIITSGLVDIRYSSFPKQAGA